jgi:hypothetical protein
MESNLNKSNGQGSTPFAQTYFHGTKADLKIGDLIGAGFTLILDKEKMQNTFSYLQH